MTRASTRSASPSRSGRVTGPACPPVTASPQRMSSGSATRSRFTAISNSSGSRTYRGVSSPSAAATKAGAAISDPDSTSQSPSIAATPSPSTGLKIRTTIRTVGLTSRAIIAASTFSMSSRPTSASAAACSTPACRSTSWLSRGATTTTGRSAGSPFSGRSPAMSGAWPADMDPRITVTGAW